MRGSVDGGAVKRGAGVRVVYGRCCGARSGIPGEKARVGLMVRSVLAGLLLAVAASGARAAGAPPPSPEPARLQAGDFLAVCGDSITEQKLYSRFIEEYLLMCGPQPKLRIMQLGWNGETSWGFLGKMPTEALRFDPSAVTICFGMNDGGYAQVETNYDRYR